jgi:hypothetical protein
MTRNERQMKAIRQGLKWASARPIDRRFSCTSEELNAAMDREAAKLGPITDRERASIMRGRLDMPHGIRIGHEAMARAAAKELAARDAEAERIRERDRWPGEES